MHNQIRHRRNVKSRTVDSDPLNDVDVFGEHHDGLEISLDKCSVDKRFT